MGIKVHSHPDGGALCAGCCVKACARAVFMREPAGGSPCMNVYVQRNAAPVCCIPLRHSRSLSPRGPVMKHECRTPHAELPSSSNKPPLPPSLSNLVCTPCTQDAMRCTHLACPQRTSCAVPPHLRSRSAPKRSSSALTLHARSAPHTQCHSLAYTQCTQDATQYVTSDDLVLDPAFPNVSVRACTHHGRQAHAQGVPLCHAPLDRPAAAAAHVAGR